MGGLTAACVGMALSIAVVSAASAQDDLRRQSPHTVTKTYTTTTTLKSTRTTVTQDKTVARVPMICSEPGSTSTVLKVATATVTRREEPATVYRTVEQVPLCVAKGRIPAVHEAVAAPPPMETVTLAKPPPRRPR